MSSVLLIRVRRAWQELGRTGRVAIIGIGISGAVAVALGITIPRIVGAHLLDERSSTLERIVGEMVDTGTLPSGGEDFSDLDEYVRLRLIGGDTVRAKLWSPSGEVLWSDEPRLIGRRFELGGDGRLAFAGQANSHVSSLSHPEHEFERHFGELIEFYIPVRVGDSIPYVFEVYQHVGPLATTVERTRRTVWLTISLGLATTGLFLVGVAAAVVSAADRRRRQAERFLDQLATVRDEERYRLANAIHDDVGQPLYRLLYGLESLHGEPGEEAEIDRLRAITHEIDSAIRDELRGLQEPTIAGRSLADLLRDMEDPDPASPPSVRVRVDQVEEMTQETAEALHRAVREAVSNAKRHSEAETIRVHLEPVGGRIVARVTDDGNGATAEPGLGTMLMVRLLATVGGKVEAVANPGIGTTVTISVPTMRTP